MTGARILGVLIAIVIVAALGVSFLIRGDTAKLPEAAATGASPALPEPNKRTYSNGPYCACERLARGTQTQARRR
jgi:hypothetical protein